MNKFIKQQGLDLRNSTDLSGLNKAALLTSLSLVIFLSLFTLPVITWATVPVEKIFINADHMQMNLTSGKSVYTGSVKISQGEMVLTGDKVTIKRSNEEVESITVIGKPARYNHVTEAGKSIKAQSEHMVYIANQNKLVLTTNAHLQQPDLKLSSQKIIYDTEKKIVIAGGSDKTTGSDADAKQKQRVNITLTPKE